MPDNIFVVVAAYNEQTMIGKVISALRKQGYQHIVVVDDCSSDATALHARKAGAIVLSHPLNRGQGASLRTGMEYAIANGAQFIVHFDADGQHRPEEIKNLLAPVQKGKVDITLGSRFLTKRSKMPWFRRFALRCSVLILRIFYGLPVTDAHNGFRAMNKKAAIALKITQDRMDHASEILELIRKNSLRWKEVPVKIIYTDYSLEKGASSISGWIRILWRMIFKKIIS